MYHKRKYSHRIRERNIVLLERNRNGWNLIPGSYDLQSNHRVIERYIYTHVTWKTEIQIRIIINRTYIRAECVLPFEMEDNPSGNLAFVDKKEKKNIPLVRFPDRDIEYLRSIPPEAIPQLYARVWPRILCLVYTPHNHQLAISGEAIKNENITRINARQGRQPAATRSGI